MKKLDLTEKIICNTVRKAFELLSIKETWDEISLIKNWLKSNTCKRLKEEDETLICQSKVYIYNNIKNECYNKTTKYKKEYKMHKNELGWAGYLLMYWMLSENITGDYIINNYKIKNILKNYETLHTTSIKTAIQYIKEDMKK